MAKKKKSASSGGLWKAFGKLGQKKIIVLVLAVAAIAVSAYFVINSVGADSLMTVSCAGTKGKCIEQTMPTPTGNKVSYQVILRDSKTKEEMTDYSLNITSTSRRCFKAGEPGHPKGGCVNVSTKLSDNRGPKPYNMSLCTIDYKYYNNGVLDTKKHSTQYMPCYHDSVSGLDFVWIKDLLQYKNSSGKVLRSVTVGAPFGYTFNQNRAVISFNKLNNRKFYINVANLTETSVSDQAVSSSSNSNSSSSSGEKYSLVVDNKNLKVLFGGQPSKRCTITIRAQDANGKTLSGGVKTAKCSSSGDAIGTYPAIEFSSLDSAKVKKIYFWASDPGSWLKGNVSSTATVSFADLTKLTSKSSVHIPVTTGAGQSVYCGKDGSKITCDYAPMMQ